MVAGCLILAGGCALAADTSGLRGLYVAIALTGMGYSLVANAPSIYLLAGWSGSRAPRMIGLYLMAGTLGGVIIPPFAQFLVAGAGGWQNYWITMAIVAASLAILCALAIAEPVPIAPPTMGNEEQHDIGAESRWTFTTIFRSPRFLILAVALVASQTCVMTIASIAPAHLVSFGWTVEIAARLLALQGFVATIATGISGFLTRRFAPRTMLISALLAGTVAMLLFAYPYGWYSLIAFALLFGLSWSLVTLSVIVLMIGIFGDIGGTTAIATMWMLAGLAAFGPWVAGLSADANLGFASVLAGLGILLVPIALIIPFLVSARLISPKV